MLQIFPPLAACLLGLSWLVGSHFLPWTSWHSETMAFLAALLLGWSGLARVLSRPGPRNVSLPVAALPFIGLALVAAIQGATGFVHFWGDIWAFGFYLALCVICMALGFAAASPSVRQDTAADASAPFTLLAFILLSGALASTVIAFAQVFSLSENSKWIVGSEVRRPGGNLAQPNHLATLLVMGIASLVFVYQSKKLGPLASSLLLLLLGAGLAITESRTGALSFLALLGWWLLKRRAISDPTPRWVGIGAGITFVCMFCAWPHLLNAMDLLSDRAQGRALEGSLRFQVWPQLLKALTMRPWTGWGIHQVAAALNAVADAYPVSEPYTYSHNLVLDLALWLGAPLALLLVGAAAIWTCQRVRAVNHVLPWYGLAMALPFALHSMLEYPHAYAYFLAPVMFLLGAVEASTGVKPIVRIGIKPIATVLLVITVAMSWSVIEYLKIEEDFRAARFQALRIGLDRPADQRPEVLLYDQLGTLLDATRTVPAPDMSPKAMLLLKEAALHYPWSATQYRYAVALALNRDAREAVRQLKVMRAMWGEKTYAAVQKQIAELAASSYPELSALAAPSDE